MYNDCKKGFEKKGKKKESVILSILQSTKNNSRNAILEGARQSETGPNSTQIDLINEGMIVESSPGKFTITGKGLWTVERELGIDPLCYMEYIDSKIIIKRKSLSEKNRIILLALLGSRSFNKSTAVTLETPSKSDSFEKLLTASQEFLYSRGLIKKKTFGKKTSSKSDIGFMLGEIDVLPSATYMIFQANNGGYYLDIVENLDIKIPSVTMLVKLILGKNITYDLIDQLKTFCKESSFEYGFIFSDKGESFEGVRYDYDLDTGINEAIMN